MAYGANSEVGTLKEDVRRLREDVQGLLSSSSRGGGITLGKTVSREGREAVRQAQECSEEALSQSRKMGQQALGETRRAVARRPLSSLLLMLFGGLVIGALLDSLRLR